MSSARHVLCGPCSYDEVNEEAIRWCTNCEEGLCEACEKAHRKSKILRNHKVISIEDYHKIEYVSISQICEHHGETLEWFCKVHDETLCMVCVPSNHKTCSDVLPISVASTNASQSTALSDLEGAIEGTLLNVRECTKNRKSASNDIDKRESDVKNMILETRTKFNDHLDKLQEEILCTLRSTAHNCKSKYIKFLQKLESLEEMLMVLKEQVLHMKQFSSDIQVFLGTRQANKRIADEIEFIKNEIGASKDYEFNIDLHGLIEKLSNEIQQCGHIQVSERATNLYFRDPKLDQAQIGITIETPKQMSDIKHSINSDFTDLNRDQAQIGITIGTPKTISDMKLANNLDLRDPKLYQAQIGIDIRPKRNISDIKLQFITEFEMKKKNDTMNSTDCVILPNDNLLLANLSKKKNLVECRDTGESIRDIPLSSSPFNIAVIDDNRIVVSYGSAKYLEIMNSSTFHVETNIRLPTQCWGVSHECEELYVRSGYSAIQVLDLLGSQVNTLKIASDDVFYITTRRGRIFYSDEEKNMVYCCDLDGRHLWQLFCESMKSPVGVTVDNNDNVYVVSYDSSSLTIIQHDGKDSKTLLKKSNGLDYPRAVYYDKVRNTLVISNDIGNVALYKVE